jgi:uncharacterized protein (UPF0212 family)
MKNPKCPECGAEMECEDIAGETEYVACWCSKCGHPTGK